MEDGHPGSMVLAVQLVGMADSLAPEVAPTLPQQMEGGHVRAQVDTV